MQKNIKNARPAIKAIDPKTPPTTGPAVIRGLDAIPPSVDSLLASDVVVDEEDKGADNIAEFDAATTLVARALLNVVRASEDSVGVVDTSLWAIANGVPDDSVGVVPLDAGLAEMASKLDEPATLDMENGFELEIALVATTALVFAAEATGGIDVERAREAAGVVGGALTINVEEGGALIGAALVNAAAVVEAAAGGGGVLLVETNTGGTEVDDAVVWAVVDIDVVVAAAVVETTATLVDTSPPPACAIFGIAVHF